MAKKIALVWHVFFKENIQGSNMIKQMRVGNEKNKISRP